MDAFVFGPFLKAERQKSGMTQAQLAERLHVTTAAVSKWERGKSLPDVAKIEEIAAALDLSVLEVLQGRRREVCTDSKEELTEVYTETLEAAGKQQRRYWLRVLKMAICALVVFGVLYLFPVYRIAMVWQPSYYTTGEVSLLAYIGSPTERKTAGDVMALAE